MCISNGLAVAVRTRPPHTAANATSENIRVSSSTGELRGDSYGPLWPGKPDVSEGHEHTHSSSKSVHVDGPGACTRYTESAMLQQLLCGFSTPSVNATAI